MTVIQSKLSPNGAEFQANAAAMQTIVDDLKAKLAVIAQGGSKSARAKHVARGKLLPRERVERLLDAGTPFWKSHRWQRMACMMPIYLPQA